MRMQGIVRGLLDAAGQVAASLARLVTVSLFVVTFLVQPSQIPTASMAPTLLPGDFLLVNKQVFASPGHWQWLLPYHDPRDNDIIVFHYPLHPPELLIKRVVAVPGDRIRLHGGAVIRNGQPVTEPFAQYTPSERSAYRDEFPNLQRADAGANAFWWIELRRRMVDGELPIPDGRYFALGDNRNNSQDSRFWGFVPRDAVVGEPLFIYLSTDQAQGGARGKLRRERIGMVVR